MGRGREASYFYWREGADTYHVGREGVVMGGEVVPVWFIVQGGRAQVYHNLKRKSLCHCGGAARTIWEGREGGRPGGKKGEGEERGKNVRIFIF